MSYYLGVDIGTTSTKAVAFSYTGEVLDVESIAYDIHHPQPTWSEQDPDEIVRAVVNSINAVVGKMGPSVPAFISFSAAMHSVIVLDKHGGLLTQCILWADNRAEEVARTLLKSSLGKKFYQLSGVPIHAMSPLSKLLWLKQNNPDVFQNAAKIIGIKEYIFFKLFKTFLVDTSVASATGLLNITTLQWENEILGFVGVPAHKFSKIVPVYHRILNIFDSNLVIPVGTPIVIGASDGALANLGTGATNGTTMAVTVGTSGAVRMVVNEPVIDTLMRTFCYHLKDRQYILGGATNNGAIVLQWLKNSVLATQESTEALLKLAENIAVGSNGLLFLPYILGERAPIWNPDARGAFLGLSIEHGKAHFVRSALEGVVYALFSIAKTLMDRNKVTEIHASGGFAKSGLWLQILADVFGIKVLVSDTVESAALGAVMVGAEALNVESRFKKTHVAEYHPNLINHETYSIQFKRFETIYAALKDL